MRYWVLTLLCLAAVIAYVQRAALSVPAADVQRDLGLDDGELGIVFSAWYLGYAVLQLPSGWLADRWGSRAALTAFAVAWSLLTGLTAFATDFAGLTVVWFLMGLAQAGVFPASAKAIGDWFPGTQRALASGLLASGMALGAALAPALAGYLLAALRQETYAVAGRELRDWQVTLLLYAVPGLLWAGLFFSSLPGLPAKWDWLDRATGRSHMAFSWARLVTSAPMQLLCAQQFLRAAAMVFFLTWFPKFLQESREVTQLQSGVLTMWPGIGVMLGGLLGGACSDLLLRATGSRRLSRQGIAVAGMVVCSLLITAAYFVPDTEVAMLLISLGAFCASFGGVSGYTVAIEFGGRHVATVFSTMNMCGNVGATLFPYGVGLLIERTGNWDLVLFLFAGVFAVDAVCWAFLNPRGPLFEESDYEPA